MGTKPANPSARRGGAARNCRSNDRRSENTCLPLQTATRVIRRFGLHPGLAGAFFTLQDVSRATGLSRRAITGAISTGKLMVVVRFKDLAAFGESRGAER